MGLSSKDFGREVGNAELAKKGASTKKMSTSQVDFRQSLKLRKHQTTPLHNVLRHHVSLRGGFKAAAAVLAPIFEQNLALLAAVETFIPDDSRVAR